MDYAPFISGWFISPETCDGLIDYFEKSPNQVKGIVGGPLRYDPERKDSIDVYVSPRDPDPAIQQYLIELKQVCNNYIDRYPWSSQGHAKWGINRDFNIQRYLPGQGFKSWHCERTGPNPIPALRHLVFMTYLNDVSDGGGTEWYHQQVIIQPKKGLTVIWPVDWTHIHRGIVSLSETKYITTGWYSYSTEENI
jgi:hypothetical protein